jgi:hypothetical protein
MDKVIWNKGLKGKDYKKHYPNGIKGLYFKGIKHQNPLKKGTHNSPKTEFKKGQKRPKEWIEIQRKAVWKGGLNRNQKLEIIAGRKKPEKCELCGRIGEICFDHDHKTGKFRGWICKKCNGALGMIDDNPQTLLLMVNYLRKNNL